MEPGTDEIDRRKDGDDKPDKPSKPVEDPIHDKFVFECKCKNVEFRATKGGIIKCLDCNREYLYMIAYNKWVQRAPKKVKELEKRRAKYNKGNR